LGLSGEDLAALLADPRLGELRALLLPGSGAGDGRGRPAAETLAAVAGYALLRTDRNGWIRLSTDGERMWVEVER
jgi:hypothetical protein